MDNVQKVCHFSNTSSSQTFRISDKDVERAGVSQRFPSIRKLKIGLNCCNGLEKLEKL
jgi:hypothetical protein